MVKQVLAKYPPNNAILIRKIHSEEIINEIIQKYSKNVKNGASNYLWMSLSRTKK